MRVNDGNLMRTDMQGGAEGWPDFDAIVAEMEEEERMVREARNQQDQALAVLEFEEERDRLAAEEYERRLGGTRERVEEAGGSWVDREVEFWEAEPEIGGGRGDVDEEKFHSSPALSELEEEEAPYSRGGDADAGAGGESGDDQDEATALQDLELESESESGDDDDDDDDISDAQRSNRHPVLLTPTRPRTASRQTPAKEHGGRRPRNAD